jgi:hypothetical protein
VSTWWGPCCHPRLPPNVGVQPGLMPLLHSASMQVWQIRPRWFGVYMAEVVHRLVEIPGPGQQSEARNREGNIPPSLRASRGTRPPQQRARVLLNLYASMRQHHPLSDTLLLLDTSQNPSFGACPTDGMVPTFTTTSQLWCLSARRYLLTWELAALMGLGTQKLKLAGQSEQWFRKRLGLAVHVPNCGLALLAVLAKPLHGCLA